MRNQEDYNFVSHLTSDEVSYFRRLVTECVLATDLAKSMSWLSSARISMIDNRVVSDAMDEKKILESKILRMQLCIKCGDVGHPSRPLSLHLEWSKRICEEFYLQGDRERSRGVRVSPLCDRNVPASSYPQGQIGFINFVSKPVFVLLSSVVVSVTSEEEKPWLTNIEDNLKYWEERKKELL